jgi:hypothetical protein
MYEIYKENPNWHNYIVVLLNQAFFLTWKLGIVKPLHKEGDTENIQKL